MPKKLTKKQQNQIEALERKARKLMAEGRDDEADEIICQLCSFGEVPWDQDSEENNERYPEWDPEWDSILQ